MRISKLSLILLITFSSTIPNNYFGTFQKMGTDHNNIEDYYYVNSDNRFFGIYDGHGTYRNGYWAAKFLSQNLHIPIINSAEKINDAVINKAFMDNHKKIIFWNCFTGSTASILFLPIINNKLFMISANVGDSKIVLSKNGKAIDISVNHKPTLKNEFERILKLGGIVHQNSNGDTYLGISEKDCNEFKSLCLKYNIDFQFKMIQNSEGQKFGLTLAMSRSLGDCSCCKYLSQEPDIYKRFVEEDDEFVIIASDGLWDVISSQQAVDFVKNNMAKFNNDYQLLAQALVNEAYTQWFAQRYRSSDDITITIVNIKSYLTYLNAKIEQQKNYEKERLSKLEREKNNEENLNYLLNISKYAICAITVGAGLLYYFWRK